ncbi:MAG: hypothetical protein IKI50_07125 [Clostridia bacterium]|nr:hypothetical protein [Clostridia bacterium]
MKTKRLLAWMLAAVMLCVLVGCTGDPTPDSSTQDPTQPSATQPTEPSVSQPTDGDPTSSQTDEPPTTPSSAPTDPTATDPTDPPTDPPTNPPTNPPTQPSTPPASNTSADVKEQGAKADGKTDDTEALKKAINAVKSSGNVYFRTGTYLIKGAVTIPKDVVMVMQRGAVIKVDSGATLTINGWIEAADSTIFAGTGTINGTPRSAGNPLWFGAAADGNTDDAPAFQKAVDLFSYVRVPYRPSKYALTGTVTIKKPVQLIGEGTSKVDLTIKSTAQAGAKAFVIRSSNVEIKNFKIAGVQSTQKTNPSSVFYFDCSSGNLSHITLENIWSGWTAQLLGDSQTSGKTITDVTLKNVTANYTFNAPGIHMTNFKSGIVLDTVLVNQVGMNPRDVNQPLFIIENCTGLTATQLDVAGGYTYMENGKPLYDVYGYGADGIVFKNCSNITVDRFMADYINGYCTKLINCTNFKAYSWVMSLYEDGALYMENCSDCQMEIVKFNGIRGGQEACDKHNGTAFVMKNCQNNTFINALFRANMADGMEIINSTDNVFKNFVFSWNNGFSYKENGSSNRNTLIGIVISSSTSKAFEQIGTESKVIGLTVDGQAYGTKTGAFSVS